MNKKDLIAAVMLKTELKSTEASKAVEAVLESVIQAVAAGNDMRLVGFGTFSSIKREAREGRNPRTGKPIKLPASKIPRFKAGKTFKAAVSSA